MKNHDLALGLPKKVEVVEVPAVPEFFLSQTAVPEKADPAPASSISKFFGHLIQTAQAKTELSS
jgi:hypothetical protein